MSDIGVIASSRVFAGLATARRVPADVLRAPLALVLAAALWAICHPYGGIVGDAAIYVGRVLADLDPNGIGRDIAFLNDGQSQFSLFPRVVEPLVRVLGQVEAAVLVALAASICIFASLVAFARAIATGRTVILILIFVAVLPGGYGDTGIFGFGETSPLPRPFAEAAVVTSLAALLTGRVWLAVGFLFVALLLHPIMAMAGVGATIAFGVWRGGRKAFVILIAAAIAAMCVAGGLAELGVPLFDRLLTVVDAEWLKMLVTRSPHLFPTRWDADAFSPLIVQSTTIVIAGMLGTPLRRRLLLAVVASSLAQLAAAAIFADSVHILLAIQVQAWRATWLLTVAGGVSLALCVAELRCGGSTQQVVLALICLGWFFQPHPIATLAICSLALASYFGVFRLSLNERQVAWVWVGVLALALAWWLLSVLGYCAFLHAMPAGAPLRTTDPLRNQLHAFPLCLIAGAWLTAHPGVRRAGIEFAALASGVTVLVAAALLGWNQRSPLRAYVDAHHEPLGFAALAAGRPPEVLWIGGMAEPWYQLGRPQYMSPQQSVGMVFSRALAKEWQRRAEALVSLGLARPSISRPWAYLTAADRLVITPEKIAAFCKRADAPGIVVVPLRDDSATLDLPGITWKPPVPLWIIERFASAEWHVIRGWTAIPCAPVGAVGSGKSRG